MSKQPKQIHLFLGDHFQKRGNHLRKWMGLFEEKHGALNISLFDGGGDSFAISEVAASLMMPPFGGEKRLVVLKGIPFESKSLSADQKKAEEIIEAMLEKLPEETVLVCSITSLDKRRGLGKKLMKVAEVHDFSTSKVGLTEDVRHLQGTVIAPGDVTYVLDRLQANPERATSELAKLQLASQGQPLSREDIGKLLTSDLEQDVFEVTGALFSGRKAEALGLLGRLRAMGEDPIKFIGLLTWNLQQLLYALDVQEGRISEKEMVALTKMKPFVLKKCMGQVRSIGKDKLLTFLRGIYEIDKSIKTGVLSVDSRHGNEIFDALELEVMKP